MTRPRLLAPLLLLAVLAPPAQAADTVLAPAANTAGITAYGGHVVLSRLDPATNRWALVRWHDGVIDTLPVAPRAVPFDADAGSDAAGRPVVVYSRCAKEPPAISGLSPSAEWQLARGCDVYELPLTGAAQERKLTTASSASQSETTPSMWRGGLAFARHADGGATPKLLYLPAGSTKLRRLGGGSIQTCASICGPSSVRRSVDQLDIGPSRAAYLWRMTGGNVYGVGIIWNLYAASLTGGQPTLLDSGLISGACGFGLPSSASARANPILYLDAGAECDVTETRFTSAHAVSGLHGAAPTPGGLAAGAAYDGDTLYWLRVTGSPADVPVPGAGSCTVAAARCELVSSAVPAFAAQPLHRQGSPSDDDLVRSGVGYHWVRGPLGTTLLRPPARVPCAPSLAAAYVYTNARWSGKRVVRALRRDSDGSTRMIGSPQTRSLPTTGASSSTKLLRCGDRIRLTYIVAKGRATGRMSFSVARAPAPKG
ncbi:MAG: hypothetical protein QOE31_2948 [Solirubrobacteraceae bacterium]|jgi:hypothetical protein|nr:hypothetical protein [Solirubrobacteraceae bacterium]